MKPGQPGVAGRRADRGIVVAVGVAESFGGELIDVGRLGVRTSVTGHPEHTVVLADNPEDVGFLGSRCARARRGVNGRRQARHQGEHLDHGSPHFLFDSSFW